MAQSTCFEVNEYSHHESVQATVLLSKTTEYSPSTTFTPGASARPTPSPPILAKYLHREQHGPIAPLSSRAI